MMTVCALLVVLLALGITTSVGGAQQAGRLYRLGTFDIAQPSNGNEVKGPGYLEPNAPFFRALRELGWIEGRNLSIERRYATSPEQLRSIAAELVRLNVDVIAVLSAGLAEVAHQATKTIPIVTISAGDLEGTGLIASLARPGGNVTGMQVHNPELMGKRIQFLKELVPSLSRLAVLEPITPAGAITANYFRSINDAAARVGTTVQRFRVHSIDEIDPAFSAMARDRVHAVLVIANPLSVAGRVEIATSAEKHRLPVMYEAPSVFAAHGLISFGAVASDVQRRAAMFVDRLFKGARAADLPVEQATKFQLVVNRRAANAIGLTIPVSLLTRADQIIE